MKGNHTLLIPPPEIQFKEHGILLKNTFFETGLVFESGWQHKTVNIRKFKAWVNHRYRKNCIQILTQKDIQPSPSLLDLFWSEGIATEILPLPTALQLAKLLIAEETPYQLLLLPKH